MKIKDLEFENFIPSETIQKKVSDLAADINNAYRDRSPIFVPILNGSFIFASDLIKQISLPCRVSFVKISSYQGTQSTGQLKTLIGHEESFFHQDVIIVEDIIDSGLTLEKIVEELKSLGARSVEVAALLRKKPARERRIYAKYIGFDIDNEFVLGYGLDYDGFGRNLNDLMKAKLA
jgi:hypoxanthine phosphoribosyltransferase